MSNNSVFKEWAQFWARRITIIRAIELLRPRPSDKNELNETRLSLLNGKAPADVHAHLNFAGIITLQAFERFTFVMSILEEYSVHECSLLLGCLRRDVIDARIAAIQHLASVASSTETEVERNVFRRSRVNSATASALTCLVDQTRL